MYITEDEYGNTGIPGYACEACHETMVPKNPEKLNLKKAYRDEVYKKFKKKKLLNS